ncbi:hypothetical protein BB542_04110 [Escherichia coli]|nr:hypothetical protein BB541_03940 [Escherichia coli]PBU55009.1 hypothetical protein BB542_04110 [Escherichia coli]PBU96593.1 hypothetical protein BB550_03940 [Escherichia coli]
MIFLTIVFQILYSSYFKLHVLRLRVIRPIHGPHPLRGRCKQRSNPLHADLSFTPVTYLCKLLGINERHPCLSPKASLRLGKFVPDEFVTRLSRYSAFGLALSGPTQALFKTPLAFCPATRII